MKKTKVSKIVLIVFAVVFLVLSAVIFRSCSKPNQTVQFSGKISNIEVQSEENRVILNLQGEGYDFVWYDSDVEIAFASNVKIGDSAVFTVGGDYETPKLVRIYTFTLNGTVVFDKEQEHIDENKEIGLAFASLVIGLALTLLFIAIKPLKQDEKIEGGFIIRAPKFVYYMGVCFFIPFALSALVCLIGVLFAEFSASALAFMFIMLMFMILGALLTYVYFKEKFVFDGETFTYHRPFLKAKSVTVGDVAFVRLQYSGVYINVFFVSPNGKTLLKFLDDGNSFRTGEFLQALAKHNIPLSSSIYSKDFNETKNVMADIITSSNLAKIHLRLRIYGREYLVVFSKDQCLLIKGAREEDVVKFASFEEFFCAPVFNGVSLQSAWFKVEAFEHLTYPVNWQDGYVAYFKD